MSVRNDGLWCLILIVSLQSVDILCLWTVCVFVCKDDDQEARNEGRFEARRWDGYFDSSKGFVQTFTGSEEEVHVNEGKGGEEEE